jgi:hypothetical protein
MDAVGLTVTVKVNGVPATPDVYVYIAEVTCDNGTVYFHKGNTTILK